MWFLSFSSNENYRGTVLCYFRYFKPNYIYIKIIFLCDCVRIIYLKRCMELLEGKARFVYDIKKIVCM